MKRIMLGLVAMAALGAAAPASAQQWGGDYGFRWNDGGRYGFRGYPEFRGEKDHILGEIREGLDEGWLGEDQARAFNWRLRRIQQEEASEFREHGWTLPDNDRAEIGSDLHQLDRAIDEARDDD